MANAGDGAINAFNLPSGKFAGRLRGTDGHAIAIDGLRAIGFGNGLLNQPVDTLFFSAAPGDGAYGLYGRLDTVASRKHQHQHQHDAPDNDAASD